VVGDYYKECYRKIKDEHKHMSEYSVMELTGYYLDEYPNNSIDRLLYDMENNDVPYVLGAKAKLLIEVIVN
jgi:hypothetical protein